MTTDTRGADTRETVAVAGFAGFLALVLGPIGLFIAAVAVGVERAWTNGVGSGSVPAAARRSWADSVAGHRAWLDWDRQRRATHRAAVRRWLDDGADPALAPGRPKVGAGFGMWLRRAWARTAIAGTEFGTGFAAGLRAARKVKTDGGSFADIIRARPDERPAAPVATNATPVGASRPDPAPAPTTNRRRAGGGGPAPVHPASAPAGNGDPPASPAVAHPPAAASAPIPPEPSAPKPDEGTTMTSTAQTGETHADITLAKLTGIGSSISQAENLNDQAAATASNIDAQVAEASEYADDKGATAATRQALDEAKAVSAAIRETVAKLADLCARAGESVDAATVGMRPAIDAQDGLATAGARGDIVATATSD